MSRSINNLNSKVFIYVSIGFFVGLLIRINILSYQYHPKCKRHVKASAVFTDVESHEFKDKPVTVNAKSTKFNNNYRPYFVYSELGFKDFTIIGVKITENQLINYGVNINNTWSIDNQNIILFTPYSRNLEFHDRYVKKLNLNIVQLPDIMENSSETEFSLRVLQYMKDHYLNNFNWFVLANSDVYINVQNLHNYLKLLNSTSETVIVGKNSHICDIKSGLILSHNAMSKFDSPKNGNFNPLVANSLLLSLENKFRVFCVSYNFRIVYKLYCKCLFSRADLVLKPDQK